MDTTEQQVIRRAATVAAAVMTASLIVGVAVGTGGPGGGHRGPGGADRPVTTVHSTGSMKPVGATGTADRDAPPVGARARTPDTGSLRLLTGNTGPAAPGTPGGTVRADAPWGTRPDAAPGPVRMRLPAPTGAHPVGITTFPVTDRRRPDPWMAGRSRELMVSVRYPARAGARLFPRAPQMLPGEAAGFDELNTFTPHVPAGKVDWAATATHAHEGAPPAPHHGRLPVLLYSPGAFDPRALGSTLCDELASRGYVVVSVDHTYEAPAVEFPGGRVVRSLLPAELARAQKENRVPELLRKVSDVRADDLRSVLDALGRPDAARALPDGLRGALDLGAVGAFGQSAGGFTAALALHDDPRVKAAVNMDGVMGYTQKDDDPRNPSRVGTDGVNRPLLLLGMDGDNRHTVASWGATWAHSSGPLRGFMLKGSRHASYTDGQSLIPQIARSLKLPQDDITALIGTVPPRRAVAAEKAYVSAFFERWLRGRDDGGLLDGDSTRYPEMRFVP
ncbi:alpha/beta hydrolase family protein [Streptomyces catenulae]|uniref:Hydrolase n=1 Tax=Streptomyces catenulae TaxID=66875 RepID=A0ABV2Z5S6_9ACTN|nr:hydrolase [Streptomyces catenulae]